MTYIPEGSMSEDETRRYVQRQTGDEAEAFAVILKEDNCLIGHISFHPWFAVRTYEIGWVFQPTYHGQGYATEGAHALIRYGFEELDLHRVIATCQPENPASYRVMEKLGMQREGHFRKCIYRGDNQWWDEYFYAILREDWAGRVDPPSS